jgi:hypothetical protein
MHLLALRRLALPLAAFGLVAAGCGGDPPAPPPFTPSTAASSPTPTGPVEPVLPEAAKQPTAEGAKAFAEFYWEQAVNYAQATGDTRPARAVSAKTCRPCASSADAIDGVYSVGGSIRGGEYTVTSVGARPLAGDHPTYVLRLQVRSSAQEIDYPDSARDQTLKAGTSQVRMYVDFVDAGWVASVVEPVS